MLMFRKSSLTDIGQPAELILLLCLIIFILAIHPPLKIIPVAFGRVE
jgi:hypothetical protein